MARQFATRIGSIRVNRFAGKRESTRRKKKKKNYFHNARAIRANHLKPAVHNFYLPEARFAKEGVQFGNPETIRENQAISVNLGINSRESDHVWTFLKTFGIPGPEGPRRLFRDFLASVPETSSQADKKNSKKRFSIERGARCKGDKCECSFWSWFWDAPSFSPPPASFGDSFWDPNHHIQGKNMNKNKAAKRSSLPCFEALWVIFCPGFCSYFFPCMWGVGSLVE